MAKFIFAGSFLLIVASTVAVSSFSQEINKGPTEIILVDDLTVADYNHHFMLKQHDLLAEAVIDVTRYDDRWITLQYPAEPVPGPVKPVIPVAHGPPRTWIWIVQCT